MHLGITKFLWWKTHSFACLHQRAEYKATFFSQHPLWVDDNPYRFLCANQRFHSGEAPAPSAWIIHDANLSVKTISSKGDIWCKNTVCQIRPFFYYNSLKSSWSIPFFYSQDGQDERTDKEGSASPRTNLAVYACGALSFFMTVTASLYITVCHT